MCETILMPLGGSHRAVRVIPHVEALARRFDVNVVLLRVLEPSCTVGFEPCREILGEPKKMEEEMERYLALWQGTFREKVVAARKVILWGPVVRSILDVADKEHADLIAMGSHGRTGLPLVFYGSVAADVLHRADRPLFAHPRHRLRPRRLAWPARAPATQGASLTR